MGSCASRSHEPKRDGDPELSPVASRRRLIKQPHDKHGQRDRGEERPKDTEDDRAYTK